MVYFKRAEFWHRTGCQKWYVRLRLKPSSVMSSVVMVPDTGSLPSLRTFGTWLRNGIHSIPSSRKDEKLTQRPFTPRDTDSVIS